MEVGIEDLKTRITDERAQELNPYGEQPVELAKEAAEYEASRVLPSYKIFPDKAKEWVERDLAKLFEVSERITNTLPSLKTGPEAVSVIENNLKFADPVPFFECSNYGIKSQNAWVDKDLMIPAILPWCTQEHLLLIKQINNELKQVAKVALKFKNRLDLGTYALERIEKLGGGGEYFARELSQVKHKVENLSFTDELVYHGLSRSAFLDVLESGCLNCRAKQISERGNARFNTLRSKMSDQELYNTSFSNRPDRTYTGNWDNDPNYRISSVLPEDLWIVTDLGWLVKSGQRFFFSDGWQMMGKVGDGGFSLSLDTDPVVVMTTERSSNVLRTLINKDPRFQGKNSERWLENHLIVIPETIIPQEKLIFDLPEKKEKEIGMEMRQLNPSIVLSKHKGFLLPSGELYDDQFGKKVMSYCWVEGR